MKRILLYGIFVILALSVLGCEDVKRKEKTDLIAGKWRPVSGVLITNGVESRQMRSFEKGHFIYFQSNGDYRSEKQGRVTEEGTWTRKNDEVETRTRLAGESQERHNKLTIEKLNEKTLILFQGTEKYGVRAVYEREE